MKKTQMNAGRKSLEMSFINCIYSKFYYPLVSIQLFSNILWPLLQKLSSKLLYPIFIAYIFHCFQFICSIIRYCSEWSWYHYQQLFLLAWLVFLPSLISSDLTQYWPDFLYEMDEHSIFLSTSKGIVQYEFIWSNEAYFWRKVPHVYRKIWSTMTRYYLITERPYWNQGFPLGNLMRP